MALAPLYLGPPQRHFPTHPVPPGALVSAEARAIHQAGAGPSAGQLKDELESLKENSLELRLIRAMLMKLGESSDSTGLAQDDPEASSSELHLETSQAQYTSLSQSSDDTEIYLEASFSQSLSIDVLVEADGDTRISATMSQSASFSAEISISSGGKKQDPLVLDLDGDGLETSGIADGAFFDIDADGSLDRLSVAARGDALLALDVNGNGRIDDGGELFGDQNGAANGFTELARYDDNSDGQIDAADSLYAELRLLSFASYSRQLLQSLAGAKVSTIYLGYAEARLDLGAGDERVQSGSFERTDGTFGEAADLLLRFDSLA